MQKITPFLWFDNQAEEAVNFYAGIFRNFKIGKMARYGEAGPRPTGSVMTAEFELEGMKFLALNGGPISNLPRRYRLSSAVKRRTRSTITGKS